MRPAQLRRFAEPPLVHSSDYQTGFNEAGAAAPVCQAYRLANDKASYAGFNEAGAAAPVCPNALRRTDFSNRRFNEAGAAAPVCHG